MIAAIVINLFLIFRIGFSTLISFSILMIMFGSAMALAYFVARNSTSWFIRRIAVFALAPGIVNFFLVLNFLFSNNDREEVYAFEHELQKSRRGWQKTSLIKLENDTYEDYIGIRVFLDYESMENSWYINYKMADGLFGFKVMKSYEFN